MVRRKRSIKFFAGTLRKVEEQVNDYLKSVEDHDWADVKYVPFGLLAVAMVFAEAKEFVEKPKKKTTEVDLDKLLGSG